ncbi:GGDEF domain-containing protein [Legionella jordanis]|nr:GGDEF domain-containing protein [Legionella jordanis]RMX05452.1 GGDEF domain-containing protein [Legionella jordanis]RMX19136.1 GGDEF domain-containing protein [Legionella jordanis]
MMLDQQSKKKSAHTLSEYEKQCHKLQTEVNVLKKAIDQLTTLPSGIHLDLDKHLVDLKKALKKNKDSKAIQSRVASLVDVMSHLQQQRQDEKILITDFIHQGANLLHEMLIEFKDKAAFEKMEQLLKTDADERKLIKEFGKLLTECITTVAKQIEYCEQHHHHFSSKQVNNLNTKLNAILHILLDNLPAPEHLKPKQEMLRLSLEEDLTEETLITIVDELKELVINSYQHEQHHLKAFVSEFSQHLRDLDKYLRSTTADLELAEQETQHFEEEVNLNIQNIKQVLKESDSTGQLSEQLNASLAAIKSHTSHYVENELTRLANYEQRILVLQDKILETEHGAEDIKRMLSFEQIRNNIDPLTGLPNKMSYQERIQEAYNRWRRGFGELSLAIANMDNFKSINDHCGHLIGDKILKEIARIFRTSIRAVDFLACYGGEEFVFIFERTQLHHAVKVAEGLRNAIEGNAFYMNNHKILVTVSFGLTNLQHGDNLESLFKRADAALFEAKQSGRNCIVSFK